MRVEILCTGDEILTGKTVNTNYSHIARRLVEVGLGVHWGTTVGDDRESLLKAFHQAGERADAVIVNGGLGPTVDDLSQEIAAQACGVDLVLSDYWMTRMEESYARRGRVMPPNNKKQAMLPANAEFIDNPIGTACGFAVTIGKARFFFTPGVPREMRRMLDEQVLPRILAMSGLQGVTKLKRFHTFGIGESRADQMLGDIGAFKEEGGIKLGFQAHYPQLETKLALRADNEEALAALLAPAEAEVRKRLGNFIVAEDEQTIEGVILGKLLESGFTLAIAETVTGGHLAARLAPLAGAERAFRRGTIARDLSELGATAVAPDEAASVAKALRTSSGASHALVVLLELDEGADRPDMGGTICIGLADAGGTVTRQARLVGGRDWVRIGATELGLDCLRRHLLGLPVDERIDFERR
ncbi:MAG: CinA family nicotinamide mononucleotide deamidase-related protein [Reyranella sp.]|uniref:CinA family nicotinamide mononucleotide deamidase-related protein n=1 Tax=Reyranella sp. TaxID=1929291 RepID=UPI0012242B72|nr:CinA family nicotinamide mononucleotide deamidase-related protein [Reyranella sp.]TAJ85055.1 MAG: CinA family nicotinamide mononucleotide deamidase-related protein [Reyranella sp.]